MSDDYTNALARFLQSEKAGYDATPSVGGPYINSLMDFMPHAKAFAAGAVNPFNLTTAGLDALGLSGAAKSLRDAEAENPAAALSGGLMMPGLGFIKAVGVPAKSAINYLLAQSAAGYKLGKEFYDVETDEQRREREVAESNKRRSDPRLQVPSADVTFDGNDRGTSSWGGINEILNEGLTPKSPMTYPDYDQNMVYVAGGNAGHVDGKWRRWRK